jgi:hypothetical protein
MKKITIIILAVISSFALGWWFNNFHKETNNEMGGVRNFESSKNENLVIDESDSKSGQKSLKRKTFHDYTSNDIASRWAPARTRESNYLNEITFDEKTVSYAFHGQCVYDYFTYLRSDSTLDVLWSYRMDCKLNMDFLEKSYGIKNHPIHGDVFATFTLTNDSTITVNYHFPDWTNKINAVAQDSIFPAYYFLLK